MSPMSRPRPFCVACLFLLAVFALETAALPLSLSAAEPSLPVTPYVNSAAALLMEWHTGTLIYEHNAFKRMHPASITKMMTALLTLEQGCLEDSVEISWEAASQPGSSMYLKEGDVFTVQDLLYGLMLNSGNDAAWALAEYIGGTAEEFFDMMNQRAREMGAVNTRFSNPHGITDPNHYTTAFDLALIAKTCLKHPYFRHLVATKEKDVIEAEKGVVTSLENTNRLLWLYLGADGVKTGTTESAGQCLVASATRDGMRLLAVVLDSGDRWSDAARLLEYGFGSYRVAQVAVAGETLVSLPAKGSFQKTVPIVCVYDLFACVPRDRSGLRVEVDLPKVISAPMAAGTVVGRAVVYLGDDPQGHTPLATGEWINARTPAGVLIRLASSILKKLLTSGIL